MQVEPEAVRVATCRRVVNEQVVRVSDPPGAWGRVRVQQTPRAFGLDSEVGTESVFGFNCIFNEESMAHRVECYIFLDC